MKKLIALIIFPFLIIPYGAKANDNFSVEIEALTLVMEQYKEDTESSVELDIEDKKPSYMALKQDECNATVEVTEKTGLEVVNTCLLYTSPSPRDGLLSRMPSSA